MSPSKSTATARRLPHALSLSGALSIALLATSAQASTPDEVAPTPAVVDPAPAPTAVDDPGPAPEREIRDAAMCPGLFGDRTRWETNRTLREADLFDVEDRDDVVEITHRRDWDSPFYLEFTAFSVEQIDLERAPPTAVVEIDSEAIRDVSCPSGLYRVSVDAALGEKGRVLGVFGRGLLVEYGGGLGYLLTDSALPPTWQMVWRSGWTLPRPRSQVSSFGGSRSSSKRNRNRNRKRDVKRKRKR